MKSSHKILKVIIGILIILDAFILWFILKPSGDFKENVVVTNLNMISNESKIPLSFPQVIYLEKQNIIDSYVMEYLDRGVKVSGVTYITQKNSNDLFDAYNQSLTDANYILNSNETKKDQGIMYFTKNKDTLNILINKNTPKENQNTVQLVYTQNFAK